MADLVSAVIRGATFGSIYALLAVGLVLAYKTSGVFNLAFGAQAFVSGAIYYELRDRHGWPIPLAVLVAVVVVAPLLGLVLDRVLFRFLRTALPVAKLVVTLGLLVAIPEITKLAFDPGTAFNTTGIVPGGEITYHPLKGVFLDRNDIATVVATAVIVLALVVMFRRTALGLRMRAVVESPRLTELSGVSADRVSAAAWMLSSLLAGLAGVLIAPRLLQISEILYTPLVVAAVSAAVFGSLSNIPLAFVGGLLLGILQQILVIYLPTNSVLATNLRPSLPFVALFVVLVASPLVRNRREVTDPLSGVDPPPPALAATDRPRSATIGTRVLAVVFLTVAFYYLLFHANEKWVGLAGDAVIYSILFLSITVITGMAGQISLCQSTFAGIGALATAQLATQAGLPVLVGALLAACIAASVGGLLAIPALRLGGIFLALLTFGFGLFFESVMVKFTWVAGGNGIIANKTPRPQIGMLNFTGDKSFLVLCTIILAVVSILVINVRNGTIGHVLDALRGSEVGAASIGVNPARARILAFALSAGIAGFGGGLLAMKQGAATYQTNFLTQIGLFWIVIVVTLGARTVEGAINAGVAFIFFSELVLKTWIPWLVNHVQPWYHMGSSLPLGLQFVFFGLGAITFARHPEGILEYNKRLSAQFMQRRVERRARGSEPPSTSSAPGGYPAAASART